MSLITNSNRMLKNATFGLPTTSEAFATSNESTCFRYSSHVLEAVCLVNRSLPGSNPEEMYADTNTCLEVMPQTCIRQKAKTDTESTYKYIYTNITLGHPTSELKRRRYLWPRRPNFASRVSLAGHQRPQRRALQSQTDRHRPRQCFVIACCRLKPVLYSFEDLRGMSLLQVPWLWSGVQREAKCVRAREITKLAFPLFTCPGPNIETKE